MSKHYDQAYFDRWYRDPKHRVKSPLVLERKVAMAVAMAEHYLGHPIRSVIDIGCGEAPWRGFLKLLRPKVEYFGLDSSDYVVGRYGLARDIRLCRFGDLEHQRFDRDFDLLICSDVLHYVPTRELLRGLEGFADLCPQGFAFLELMCRGDDFVGDHEGFIARTAKFYRKAFAQAGFTACGSHGYLSRALREEASSLELGARDP
ncbi:MAG TPA: class I SAM-dependent methyltransferase [Patescibacteria group bacterium]|nr:class I SAM-dependent methyltransferase [Patescibacteria group bacterium]